MLAAVLAAGCGDQLGSASGPNVLKGGYVGEPEAAPGVNAEMNQPGTVRLLRDGERVAEQKVDQGQEFSFSVQRGLRRSVRLVPVALDAGGARLDPPEVDADILCQIK